MASKLMLPAALALALALTLAAPLAAAQTTVTITAKESGCPKTFCFETSPSTIDAGRAVTVNFQNPQNNGPHNVCLQVGAARTCTPGETQYADGGQSGTLTFTAPDSGSVTYWCSVPGHRQLGMEGALNVTGTPPPPPPSGTGNGTTQPPPTTNPDTQKPAETPKGTPAAGLVSIALGVGLLAVALRRRA